MQLNPDPAPPQDEWWSEPTEAPPPPRPPQSAAMREYEARRCHVCQAKYPPFGFGPPLTRPDQVLWACGMHRHNVESMLAGNKGATRSSDASSPKLV